jgi:hypothetical protein
MLKIPKSNLLNRSGATEGGWPGTTGCPADATGSTLGNGSPAKWHSFQNITSMVSKRAEI